MKKIILLITTFIIATQITFAASIDKTISKSNVNKGAISVSVKDVQTGKTVFEHNPQALIPPASTLKMITLVASLDTLKEDFEFSTKLYKDTNNDLYLTLSADPYLTSSDLNKLMKTAKEKNILSPKSFYIDDYLLDTVEWGEGWQWDDELNPFMPKFSSYNIDENMLNIILTPNGKGVPINIRTSKFYPTTFINLAVEGTENNITLSRKNYISPNVITVEGTIAKQITERIPVNYPKRYFIFRLEDAIRNNHIEYYGQFTSKKLPDKNIYLVAEIKHPINKAIQDILKNSNNLVAETVFKVAGAKFTNKIGTLENSLKMLETYYSQKGLNIENIRITDGSGASKNNLVSSDFMTDFLVKNANNELLKNNLPTPGEGTLTNRMLYFKDNLKAKTGTHADVSAIAGYITSRNGKLYAFDIMINDPKLKNKDKKSLEEYIIRDIYSIY